MLQLHELILLRFLKGLWVEAILDQLLKPLLVKPRLILSFLYCSPPKGRPHPLSRIPQTPASISQGTGDHQTTSRCLESHPQRLYGQEHHYTPVGYSWRITRACRSCPPLSFFLWPPPSSTGARFTITFASLASIAVLTAGGWWSLS